MAYLRPRRWLPDGLRRSEDLPAYRVGNARRSGAGSGFRCRERTRTRPVPQTGGSAMTRITRQASSRVGPDARDADHDGGPGRPGVTGAASSTSSTTFGTLPSPCGTGHATGATDQGVTNSTINIAYGDDRGFSGSPGLDQEMGDAVKAMIAWCNAQGGINGRKIVGDYYDSAVTNVGIVMTQACKTDFMLVGEGFALDGAGRADPPGLQPRRRPGLHRLPRRGQRLRDVPGVAEPGEPQPGVDRLPGREALRLEDAARGPVRLHPLDPASSMAKAVQAYTEAGWKFVNCPFLVNYNGEANYTPFVQKLAELRRRRSSSTTPPRGRPSTAPSRPRTRSATTRSGCWTPPNTRRPSRSGTPAGWATTSTSASAYEPLEAAKVVPAVAAVPLRRQEVRRPHVGTRRAVRLVLPSLGHRGQGVRLDPDPPVHDQPSLQGDELDRRRAQRAVRPGQEPARALRAS